MKATMKLALVCAAAAMLCTGAYAQTTTDVKPRKFSVHVGATALVFGGEPFGGLASSLGLLANPKNLFMLEFNSGFGSSEQIGSYSYYVYTPGSSNGSIRNDGKINYGYSSFEVVFSYSRLFNLSEKWQFRVGPAVGLVGISAGDSYTEANFDGTVEGLPDPQSVEMETFMAGILAGFRWNFSPRGSLDINYMLSGHDKIIFAEREMTVIDDRVTIAPKEFGRMSHRFNLTVGWRLGNSKK